MSVSIKQGDNLIRVDSLTPIADNLTTEEAKVALSAKQGKKLKQLLDTTMTPSDINDIFSLVFTGVDFNGGN